jgi:hypothetical protein
MLSDAQKTRVWQGMMGTEIRAKYFAVKRGGRGLRYRSPLETLFLC